MNHVNARFVVRNDGNQYLTKNGTFVSNIKDESIDVRNVFSAGGMNASSDERLKAICSGYGLSVKDLHVHMFDYTEMYHFRCCSVDSHEYPEERSEVYLTRC